MTNKTLIMTVGLPRSGKSTWSRKTIYPIVNPDSIRLALYNKPFIKECEPMVWTITRYMVKSLFLAGHEIVILDATNLKKSDRLKWISKDWTCQYQYFDTSVEVCIERAIKTNTLDLIDVINRMDAQKDLSDILPTSLLK